MTPEREHRPAGSFTGRGLWGYRLLVELGQFDWQLSHRPASQPRDCVGKSGCQGRQAGLAHHSERLVARNHMHCDLRCQPQSLTAANMRESMP